MTTHLLMILSLVVMTFFVLSGPHDLFSAQRHTEESSYEREQFLYSGDPYYFFRLTRNLVEYERLAIRQYCKIPCD